MFVDFVLRGTMPILFHADDLVQNDMVKTWQADPANKKKKENGDDRSPPWTWKTYLYSDGEFVTWPAANMMTCLREAGTQVILHKQTTCKAITQTGILMASEYLEFRGPAGQVAMSDINRIASRPTFAEQCQLVKPLGFSLFAKRAKVNTSKHVRVRARFEEWTVQGSCQIVDERLTAEKIKHIFAAAGPIGMGDWRPGGKTPGPFGMFQAEVKIRR